MNFLFVSPHFPTNFYHFCVALKENGVNVLGVGDTAYDNLSNELKGALTEYYKVNSLENRVYGGMIIHTIVLLIVDIASRTYAVTYPLTDFTKYFFKITVCL